MTVVPIKQRFTLGGSDMAAKHKWIKPSYAEPWRCVKCGLLYADPKSLGPCKAAS